MPGNLKNSAVATGLEKVNMPANMENSAVATGLENVFSFQSQRRAMPKNVQTAA